MSALARRSDWPERLASYLKEAASRQFCWGRFDCVLFALGAAEAMTGIDAAATLRGSYDSALGATKRMRVLYGSPRLEDAAEAFRQEWGGEEISPLMVQRGDIALADVALPEGGRAPALGVVALDGRGALFAGPAGMVRVPLKECRLAWRVG